MAPINTSYVYAVSLVNFSYHRHWCTLWVDGDCWGHIESHTHTLIRAAVAFNTATEQYTCNTLVALCISKATLNQSKMKISRLTAVLVGLIASGDSISINGVAARGTSIIPSAPPVASPTSTPADGLHGDKRKTKKVHVFFKAYGWLRENESIPEDKLPAAIRKIQKVLRLPQTGAYDDVMDTVMSKPRCGTVPQYNPSEALDNNLHSRYVMWGPKWDHTSITYRFINYTADLPVAQQRSIVRYVT